MRDGTIEMTIIIYAGIKESVCVYVCVCSGLVQVSGTKVFPCDVEREKNSGKKYALLQN